MAALQPRAHRRFPSEGFTLIELIVVIVILSVLAATALPKFLDLRTQARTGILDRTAVEVAGGANLAFAKCQLVGNCNTTGWGTVNVTSPGGVADVLYAGYPLALTHSTINLCANSSGFTYVATGPTYGDFRLDGAPDPTNCAVRYAPAFSGLTYPVITKLTSGC